MDYKYIEQLLERYWECQTTLEEEAILRNFFRQEDVPASLLPYRQFFNEQDEMAEEHLGKDFADKMLRLVGEETPVHVCKARRLTFMCRLRPSYRAAGLIAILLTIGNAAHQSFSEDEDIADSQQMAESIAADSLQQITIGQPEQQSAELTKQPIDTINTLPR
jgi:hypothetical protein